LATYVISIYNVKLSSRYRPIPVTAVKSKSEDMITVIAENIASMASCIPASGIVETHHQQLKCRSSVDLT